MITMSTEEFEILTDEIARLTGENAELQARVDWLLRERLDHETLRERARSVVKPPLVMPPEYDAEA